MENYIIGATRLAPTLSDTDSSPNKRHTTASSSDIRSSIMKKNYNCLESDEYTAGDGFDVASLSWGIPSSVLFGRSTSDTASDLYTESVYSRADIKYGSPPMTKDVDSSVKNSEVFHPLISTSSTDLESISTLSKRNGFRKIWWLPVLSFTLHVLLIVIHILLLLVGLKRLEHRIVLDIEHQNMVSLGLTVITTTFSTTYLSLLIFLTQKLALQLNLRKAMTLTALHDNTSAWSGIGSAVVTLYKQISLPAATSSVLAVVGYLGCVSVLHTTFPALFAVQTFNVSHSTPVEAQGFNSAKTLANSEYFLHLWEAATDFSPWITKMSESQTLGLYNGSIYDVLRHPNPAGGQAQVSATGFNVTCGYLPGVNSRCFNQTTVVASDGFSHTADLWEIQFGPANRSIAIISSGPNMIHQVADDDFDHDSIIMYTPNPVVDSHGQMGEPVELVIPMGPNSSVTHIQLLKCTISAVNQTAAVDSQTRRINPSSFQPNIHKNLSTMGLYSLANETAYDSIWSDMMYFDPESNIPTNLSTFEHFRNFDIFMMEHLGLDPSWLQSGVSPTSSMVLLLHEIENAVSAAVAAYFWTVIHIKPIKLEQLLMYQDEIGMWGEENTLLFTTNTTVKHFTDASRVELSIVAVCIGLGSAVALCILSLPLSFTLHRRKPVIEGAGLLHVIWIFRHHLSIYSQLPHIERPTEQNLRSAGLLVAKTENYIKMERLSSSYVSLGVKSYPVQNMNSQDRHWISSKHQMITACCILLHGLFVAFHVGLLVLKGYNLDNQVIFHISHQSQVSLLVTIISTAFGTAYLSLLLLLTQKLAIYSSLQSKRTLTATHDQLTAWSGIGSAFATLYHQLYIPASVMGTVLIIGYLGRILLLHITTPALLTVEAFNTTQFQPIPTHGLPQLNRSNPNATYDFAQRTTGFLEWIHNLDSSETLGLINGSLYNVLNDTTLTAGEAQISATGFNVSCGYLSGLNVTYTTDSASQPIWRVSFQPGIVADIYGTSYNTINFAAQEAWNDTIFLFTPNQILDSSHEHAIGAEINPPMEFQTGQANFSYPQLQFLQCSLSLLDQLATVDTQSRKIDPTTLVPKVHKSHSVFESQHSSAMTIDVAYNSRLIIEGWTHLLAQLKPIGVPGTFLELDPYLGESLGLDPSYLFLDAPLTSVPALTLHNIENALSELVASVFWIGRSRELVVKYSVEDYHAHIAQHNSYLSGSWSLTQSFSFGHHNLMECGQG
ncbi:hypothetical protein MVEN_02378500 [Mycena venus]|uniref:Uncharacterized protein n=1 Tax=Mycena venus TaxID=2733690 RepID=A0A8H7CDF0_9AGAR|nr:hypothetical protein MVEN_02378500 [Mycena venus]